MIQWISESEALPAIGQAVLLASPRQTGEFWDIAVSRLSARYEGVVALPIKAGSRWPTDYFWGGQRTGESLNLVTGNSYWASMESIPLPPGAEHDELNGFRFVRQIGEAFVPQRGR